MERSLAGWVNFTLENGITVENAQASIIHVLQFRNVVCHTDYMSWGSERRKRLPLSSNLTPTTGKTEHKNLKTEPNISILKSVFPIDIELSRLANACSCLFRIMIFCYSLRPKIRLKTRLCINQWDQEFGRFQQTGGLIGQLVGFTRLVKILFE